MKKIYFFLILIIIFLIVGYFCSKEKTNEEVVTDDKITEFLEENLAWTNNQDGKTFCSYELLGKEEGEMYLWALCQEFYIANQQIICPDQETKETCFLSSKTSPECELCETIEVEPRLVTGAGTSIPIRLTEKEEGFDLWMPRDGNLYAEDIRREFPNYIADEAFAPRKLNLLDYNIEKAENYFHVKAEFNIAETFDKICETNLDCGEVPGKYAALSTCPHQMKCIESKCSVGCYNLIDPQDFPITSQ